MKYKWLRMWLIVMTAAVMTIIFGFSSQTGAESQKLSMSLVNRVLALLHMEPAQEILKLMNIFLRKLAHFTLYFVLGCCLSGALGKKDKRRTRFLLVVLLGGMFAVTDEFHQSFTLRTASAKDVLLDTCGVAAGGWMFIQLENRLWKKQLGSITEREERKNAESEREI